MRTLVVVYVKAVLTFLHSQLHRAQSGCHHRHPYHILVCRWYARAAPVRADLCKAADLLFADGRIVWEREIVGTEVLDKLEWRVQFGHNIIHLPSVGPAIARLTSSIRMPASTVTCIFSLFTSRT